MASVRQGRLSGGGERADEAELGHLGLKGETLGVPNGQPRRVQNEWLMNAEGSIADAGVDDAPVRPPGRPDPNVDHRSLPPPPRSRFPSGATTAPDRAAARALESLIFSRGSYREDSRGSSRPANACNGALSRKQSRQGRFLWHALARERHHRVDKIARLPHLGHIHTTSRFVLCCLRFCVSFFLSFTIHNRLATLRFK